MPDHLDNAGAPGERAGAEQVDIDLAIGLASSWISNLQQVDRDCQADAYDEVRDSSLQLLSCLKDMLAQDATEPADSSTPEPPA